MEEGARRNNTNRKINPLPRPKPPPPKPKPQRLVSNKVDNDSNLSSSKKLSTNETNGTLIRGSNVHKLSNVFEEKDDKNNNNNNNNHLKPHVVPTLPLSPRLPVPVVLKNKKSFSNEKSFNNNNSNNKSNNNNNSTKEIDDSPMNFGDAKARFQKSSGMLPNPTKKPAALTNRNKSTIPKTSERIPSLKTTTNNNNNNVNKTRTKTITTKKTRSLDPITQTKPNHIITDDNLSRDWIDVTEHNYLQLDTTKKYPKIKAPPPIPSTKSLSVKNKNLSRSNSGNDITSTKKQVSQDFETKRASIAILLEHNLEMLKALPPVPSPKSPTDSSSPSSPSSPSTPSTHLRTSSLLPSPNRPKSATSLPSPSLLSPSLPSPSLPSPSINSEEDEQDKDFKRRKKLWNLIRELVETEKSFYNDMLLLKEKYYLPAQQIPIFNPFDCKTIFNNLDDIIKFSGDFLKLLENAAGIEGPDDNNIDKHLENENDNTSIGAVFMQMMSKQRGAESRMESVYSEYCKRHEAGVQKLQEFDDDDNVQGWLQACKRQCEGQTRSWDIASLLIKPVQRVLKYPLLLQQIVTTTNQSHPDYVDLKSSFAEITNIAERINEIKRRKDIVEKIVGSKKKTDADLVHGITKTITRRGQMIKHATGIAKATEDELYNMYVEKFKNLESRGQQLAKDIKEWVKVVKQFFDDQPRMAKIFEELYILDNNKVEYKKLMEYVKTAEEIAPTHVKEMEEALKKNIYPQIERFLELFKAPAAVMKKRERKILDYDRAMAIKTKGGTLDKQLQQSAEAFKSISAQLNDELPSFFKLMTQYFDIIVQEFIKIQVRLYGQVGMDLRQYFCKFVDSQALEEIIYDRELVLREMDIELEYTQYYHERLEMDEQLRSFVLFSRPTGVISRPNLNERGRSPGGDNSSDSSASSRKAQNRSVSRDTKDHRKAGLWDDNTGKFTDLSYNSTRPKQSKKNSSHRKYATDSAIEIHDNNDTRTILDNEFFFCQTLYKNKSKHKNVLNYEKGVLIKVIHIDESGEWWFGTNEDTQESGWVNPDCVSKLE